MLGIVIFFSVLSLITPPITGARRSRQLDAVVQILQNQLNNDRSSSSDSSSGDENAPSVVGQNINTIDVINLIKQAQAKASKPKKDQNRFRVDNDPPQSKTAPISLKKFIQEFQQKSNRDVAGNNKIKNRVLEQYINENRKPLDKKHLVPNRLLSPAQYVYENEDRGGKTNNELSKYSKIFIILDPIALQNSRNTEDVQKLLSEILEKSSSAVEKSRHDRTDLNHYKGFVFRDSAKSRRYRESGDNEDEEYRPKRSRNDHGGGGGGGRTAIPYIRHRGDIYEKEH